ncbi:unnamed protein product [Brassica rapa]|uniref:Uncharacterized protein n=1 Tax=Brassica campestris TaxID=3711 RepID=A0A3P6AED7_BRACM|nr:unnamed protein product [Brassica rapa]VDC85834.1 unnamed protein product [Brassica rapa]
MARLSQVSIVKPSTLSTTKTQHPQHIISSALRPVTLSLTGLSRLAATARSGESRDGARESSHGKTLIVFVSILGLGFGLWCGPKFYRFKNSIWVMGLITMLASLPAFSLNVIESADCWLKSLPVSTSCLRHGNVEVCGSDSIIPSATSLDSILPSVSLRQLPPTKSTILFSSVPNPTMVSEKKIVSTTSTSCLSIVLLSGSVEIHLVSRINIVGSRAVLIRMKSLFLMRLFMALNLEFHHSGFSPPIQRSLELSPATSSQKKSSASLATSDRSPLVLHLFISRIYLDWKTPYLCNDFGLGPPWAQISFLVFN